MSAARLAPTRMGLLHARRRLDRVRRGTSLLRRKREALVREFFRLAQPAADARGAIDERAAGAYEALLEALAVHGGGGLAAIGAPPREVALDVRPGQVWGLAVSEIAAPPRLVRTLAARGTAPGPTGPAAAAAAERFEELLQLLLEAAPREALIRRLGDALAQTSRQLNTLQWRVAPELETSITATRRALDEREREEHLRLRHLVR
jgi:V/A-type H+-transporting ATPase subunit D